jgi:arginyl-tRNA--protein-N-Asp/Glu arginylyltransferase
VTSSLRDLKVYTTYPHRCSYLEQEEATTLFIDPRQSVDQSLYSNLSLLGFRRSGNHIYRPHCSHCNACIPARVPVAEFTPNRAQRRCWRRNADIEARPLNTIRDDASYALYARYIELRHADGDMYPPDRDQFESFLNDPWGCTEYWGFYAGDELLAIAVVDAMLDGLSAIYTFYEPEAEARSLGRFAILWQIEHCRERDLPYVYLGYWIRNCRKMAYKADYQPWN